MASDNVQFGIMETADFEEKTITFFMQGDYYVRAGEYAIIPKDVYRKMVDDLEQALKNRG